MFLLRNDEGPLINQAVLQIDPYHNNQGILQDIRQQEQYNGQQRAGNQFADMQLQRIAPILRIPLNKPVALLSVMFLGIGSFLSSLMPNQNIYYSGSLSPLNSSNTTNKDLLMLASPKDFGCRQLSINYSLKIIGPPKE